MSLWGEFRRRNVFKVGAAYAALAIALGTVADIIFSTFEAPTWIMQSIIVALALGLPIACFLAWAYELTPAGVRRTDRATTAGGVAVQDRSRLNYLLVGVVSGALIAAVGFWSFNRNADEEWARATIEAIDSVIDSGDYEAALDLWRELAERVPDASELASLALRFSQTVSIPSEPSGARAYRRPYESTENDWVEVGTTPIEAVRLPIGESILRFELEGYLSLERSQYVQAFIGERSVGETISWPPFVLDTVETLPGGMVRLPGFGVEIDGEQIRFNDSFLGRYEVTNRDFKEAVDDGLYEEVRYWLPIIVNGAEISLAEAVSDNFRDSTEQPGPATWVAGDYPDGQDDYPVSGVSWYEAMAYANYRNQELPTIWHWRRASGGQNAFPSFLPVSNFESAGPLPVTSNLGMTIPGAYHMGGNVREWLHNEYGDQRLIMGGGWTDPAYIGSVPAYAQPAINRDPTNGIRLASTREPRSVMTRAQEPLPRAPQRNLRGVPPIADDVFVSYREQFDYDIPAFTVIEEHSVSERSWNREQVTFDTADGRRLTVYIWLPKDEANRYQAVLFMPGLDAWLVDSIDHFGFHLDFLVRRGRAVVMPVYADMFDQDPELPTLVGAEAVIRDRLIQIHQDTRLTLDYLETRSDIDPDAFALFGFSMGGQLAPPVLALEPRLKAAVLHVGGVQANQEFMQAVDPINYVSRITLPVLMLNSYFDTVMDLETAVRPVYEMLGTNEADKNLSLHQGAHAVPREVLVRETIAWLDRYLGPVSGKY